MVCLRKIRWSSPGKISKVPPRKDRAPKKLCGSVRWSRRRKDGAPKKLCGSVEGLGQERWCAWWLSKVVQAEVRWCA